VFVRPDNTRLHVCQYARPVPGATPDMTDHPHRPIPSDRPHGDRDAARRRHRRADPTPTGPPPGGPLPDPAGDVVPGDPPVPITVWHLPRPRPGQLASADMLRRLVGNYTRPGGLAVDLTAAATLPAPGHPVALVITGCPDTPDAVPAHLVRCAASLHPGGCVAVVLPATRTPDQLGRVVVAGRAGGLTYLQHIVVAHQLTPHATSADGRPWAHPRLAAWGRPRLRVHTDLIILRLPETSRSSADA
jgi:hypothetical protein